MIDVNEEFFDIFDENNNPLGHTKSRKQVHEELVDWHRITGIWLVNKHKQLLCQQRSLKKDVYPGMWMLTFGGHVKAGETYEENVIAELEEELGLSPQLDDLVSLGYFKGVDHKHHAQLYVYHWDGCIDDIKFNDGEVEIVKLVTLDEYQEMISAGVNAYPVNPIVIEYLNHLK